MVQTENEDTKLETQKKSDDAFIIKSVTYAAIALLSVAILFSIYILVVETNFFQTSKPYDLSKIGAWGDTLGGVLNPLFSFLALLALLWTIRLQSKELGLSRKELELTRIELEGSRKASENMVRAADQQNIENAFFQLFNLLQENLQTIRVNSRSDFPSLQQTIKETGAKAFEVFSRDILKAVSNSASETPYDEVHRGNPDHERLNGWQDIIKKHPDSLSAKKQLLLNSYDYIYNIHQADLGRYFRLLYNILRFLSEKENNIPKEMYDTYFKIVRASISNYELFLIMVNCLTPAGQPMKKYASQFKLFDNLPPDIFLATVYDERYNHTSDLDLTEIWLEFDERSFGKNEHYRQNYLN